jgi:hypothetical protein
VKEATMAKLKSTKVADEATIVAGGYGYMEEDFSLRRRLEIVWWNIGNT